MRRLSFIAGLGVFGGGLALVPPAEALVYCVTNVVDEHQRAPVGDWAAGGWQETAPVGLFLATVIHPSVAITAKHLDFSAGQQFAYEGQTHTVTAVVNDAGSDLSLLFFTPVATNTAFVNIETNDAEAFVLLQGRGMERGAVVATEGRTNGWRWAWDKWLGIRRWGVNQYVGEAGDDGQLAVAAFDNNGDPDECMLSPGDSGGPGFVRTGSGWKVATINYSVGPDSFTLSTNPVSSFNASLYDCAGLYYNDGDAWRYVTPEESPAPCLMYNTRISKRLSWLTNALSDLSFPADIGLLWRAETTEPGAQQAVRGLWFEVVASNAGPYTARSLAVDFAWPAGLHIRDGTAGTGVFQTNRWLISELADGGATTLRVDAVVWRATAGWGTNRVWVAASDKPDGVTSNDVAVCVVWMPATATLLMVK